MRFEASIRQSAINHELPENCFMILLKKTDI